jgi:hypothetical protein
MVEPMLPPAEGAAPEVGEPDEKAMLQEILSTLKELLAMMNGSGEVNKEGQAGAGLENEDKKAKPVETKTAGNPQTSIASKLETDKIINKDIAEMQKQIAELKKSMNSKSVAAVRGPVDAPDASTESSPIELRKEAMMNALRGGKVDVMSLLKNERRE